MDIRRKGLARLVLVTMPVGISLCASADESTRVPTQPAAYADAPDIARSFMVAAKRAEAMHDPLARCLAYPDYPGNAWPKALAGAYCHYRFDPAVTLAMVREALDNHALAGLEARFKADLDRHFAREGFSEVIHRDFEAFDASREADQLSRRWLKESPHSAYALTARGEYLRRMATEARGTAWARDTPDKNMRQMSRLASQAIVMFQRSIAIEPRLLEAYVGLGDVAGLEDSHADIEQRAFEGGMAIDPACQVLTNYYLSALTPRWGGSYPQMIALVKRLRPFVLLRPLLALNVYWPQMDLADTISKTSYEQATGLIKPLVFKTASADVLSTVAVFSDHVKPVDNWDELMLLLEAARFEESGWSATLLRDRLLLLLAHEPVWSQASLAAAVRRKPADAYAHLLLAISYCESGEPARAEHDFVVAMGDTWTRRDALYNVTQAMLQANLPTKARRYVDRLNKEYPGDGPGWYLRAGVLGVQGAQGDQVNAALRKFVATADRSDPLQAMEVQGAERSLAQPAADAGGLKARP